MPRAIPPPSRVLLALAFVLSAAPSSAQVVLRDRVEVDPAPEEVQGPITRSATTGGYPTDDGIFYSVWGRLSDGFTTCCTEAGPCQVPFGAGAVEFSGTGYDGATFARSAPVTGHLAPGEPYESAAYYPLGYPGYENCQVSHLRGFTPYAGGEWFALGDVEDGVSVSSTFGDPSWDTWVSGEPNGNWYNYFNSAAYGVPFNTFSRGQARDYPLCGHGEHKGTDVDLFFEARYKAVRFEVTVEPAQISPGEVATVTVTPVDSAGVPVGMPQRDRVAVSAYDAAGAGLTGRGAGVVPLSNPALAPSTGRSLEWPAFVSGDGRVFGVVAPPDSLAPTAPEAVRVKAWGYSGSRNRHVVGETTLTLCPTGGCSGGDLIVSLSNEEIGEDETSTVSVTRIGSEGAAIALDPDEGIDLSLGEGDTGVLYRSDTGESGSALANVPASVIEAGSVEVRGSPPPASGGGPAGALLARAVASSATESGASFPALREGNAVELSSFSSSRSLDVALTDEPSVRGATTARFRRGTASVLDPDDVAYPSLPDVVPVTRGQNIVFNTTHSCSSEFWDFLIDLFGDPQVVFGVKFDPITLPDGTVVPAGRVVEEEGLRVSIGEDGILRAERTLSESCSDQVWESRFVFVPGPSSDEEVARDTEFPSAVHSFVEYGGDLRSSSHPLEIKIVADRPVVEIYRIETSPDDPTTTVDRVLDYVEIATWENSFDDANGLYTSGRDFVTRDPRSFSVRVIDPAANTDAEALDEVVVSVSTLTNVPGGTAVLDPPTEIVLREQDPASGVFLSVTQIATTADLGDIGDDKYAAPDGWTSSPVADESEGDRTHEARVNGLLRVAYDYDPDGGAADPAVAEVSVCKVGTAQNVEIDAVGFTEPYLDWGLDGLPDTNDCGEGNGVFDYCPTGENCFAQCAGNRTGLSGQGHRGGQYSEKYLQLNFGGANAGVYASGHTRPPEDYVNSDVDVYDDIALALGWNALDSEDDMRRDLVNTGHLLAQACMTVFGPTFDVRTVPDENNDGGFNPMSVIFSETSRNDDQQAIRDAVSDLTSSQDRFVAVYVGAIKVMRHGRFSGAGGLAVDMVGSGSDHGMFWTSTYNNGRVSSTTAHELGHMMSGIRNAEEGPLAKPYFFFPSVVHNRVGVRDVTGRRRVPVDVIRRMRAGNQ